MVKFIHAADIHLDSPFKGLHAMPEKLLKQVRASTFNAMKKITGYALSEEVDFLVISGDIYDYDDRSIRAQSFFREQMEQLNKRNIPVFIIHGNHDFAGAEASHLDMPENVYTFGTYPETKEISLKRGEKIAVSGFSYGEKWVTKRMINDYPSRSSSADWHIGMLHGFSEGGQNDHAKYAPFSLQELRVKGYDYWALGHIHIKQKLSDSPLVYYSGNPQGRNKKENGEKGCLLVELTSVEQTVSFLPTSSIQWETITIDVSESKSLSSILQAIEKALYTYEESKENIILSIKLTLHAELDALLRKKILSGELLDALQSGTREEPFVWVNELVFIAGQKEKETSAVAGAYQEEWFKAVEETNKEEVMTNILEDFFRNAPSMSMLPLDNEEYRKEILNEAIQLIYTAVGNEE